ncbi:putative lysine-specific demethylase ELF6 [Canna indica]|uniref:Lysine-specific demethylase ELF6 n=1 Tax=Canna indica TaxID=4628 RepID=A0AAQ3QIY0_9LILI|nr:putative lysine-specific demethylase ELF6 [Canna indica]
MAEPVGVPAWLKDLPLAPEYRPTETEFADPISFISRIEREAAAFGICKVIPPLPRPSKKFVLANLNRSLAARSDHLASDPPSPRSTDSPAAVADAVFTTRHQELGARRGRPLPVQKQVWQSGEFYTPDQFEAKSKAFARAQLGGFKEVNPLLIETLFWKAAAEKPIYVEYANDVPGSGFGVPEEPFRYNLHRRRKPKRGIDRGTFQQPKRTCTQTSGEQEGMGGSGWKLSNSPWNLQVIARSPGSLTRFMPDEVPGVTSPMVYIGMLFSWFAWHVEDHELHSLNFLHMGSPKTWYAVPGDYAATLEEIVRVQGYGGNMDRLASLIMLGEKTTLLSPEILVTSRVPCCRLVQHPGEFVVTFPRAYHIGFSHGFNCGEAANFATPKWLTVAKEAAVRRAAMNFLPMLSHQQLLYLLSMSFISSDPRELLSGSRSSRLRDRKKEEREVLVKKAFLDDMMNESNLSVALLAKATISSAVLWEPELLPSTCLGAQAHSSLSPKAGEATSDDLYGRKVECESRRNDSFGHKEDACCTHDALESTTSVTNTSPHCPQSAVPDENTWNAPVEGLDNKHVDEIELPFGLNVDSGSLACVACGILGYPFMAVLQPSEKASRNLFASNVEESIPRTDRSENLSTPSCKPCSLKNLHSEVTCVDVEGLRNPDFSASSLNENCVTVSLVENCVKDSSSSSHAIQDLIGQEVQIQRSSNLAEPGICMLPVSSASNDEDRKFPYTMENQLGDSRPQYKIDSGVQVEKSCDCCSSETKTNNLNGQHSCDRVEVPVQLMSVKHNAQVNGKICHTDFAGTIFSNETDKLGVSGTKCSDDITNWNTSNGFLRPRIFCLQHAIEVEKLLRRCGGVRVLLICHSDYLKIKAIAISIAEEIDIQFNCEDVPLINASRSDLELINISIDEEKHEEDGNDWTSKLGLNLKYCVKLKKQMPSNQDHLKLSLGGIFSDPYPIPVVSNLKWLSRKARTPYKVVGLVQSKLRANAEKHELVDRNTNSKTDSAKLLKDFCSLKFGLNGRNTEHQGLSLEGIPNESGSRNKGVKFDANDEISKFSPSNEVSGHSIDDTSEDLHNVPIMIAEHPQRHQLNWVTLEVSLCREIATSISSYNLPESQGSDIRGPDIISNASSKEAVYDPMKPASNQPFENSEMIQGVEEAYESEDKFCSIEFPTDMLTSKCEISEAPQGVNLVEDANENVEPACEPGSRPLLSHENLENSEDSCRRSVQSEDQLAKSTSNSELQFNNLAVQEHLGQGMVSNPAKLARNFDIDIIDGNKIEQDTSAKVEHVIDGADIMKDDNQFAVNNLAGNYSEVLQGAPCTDQMEVVDAKIDDSVKADMQTASDSSMKLAENAAFSLVESSMTQEVLQNTRKLCISADIPSSLLSNDIKSGNHYPARVDLIQYVRRRKKRKMEQQEQTVLHKDMSVSFVRGPCEGLRPRTLLKTDANADSVKLESSIIMARRRSGNSAVQRDDKSKKFKCNIEGCFMSFGTRGELSLHKRNRCSIEGCGKRFSSHKYAVRHQCVHNDDRPLKCPWKGCSMSFKWAWARTEHVRVHTGERPYKCKFSGCDQTFRFVSDFSRHRRKTGHYSTPSAG